MSTRHIISRVYVWRNTSAILLFGDEIAPATGLGPPKITQKFLYLPIRFSSAGLLAAPSTVVISTEIRSISPSPTQLLPNLFPFLQLRIYIEERRKSI
ncbi:hypothetical protein WG66_014222 [Moniliophthora roreri]|nr:hypothetical protein WG66_014222 [Moniliophthora roreri]